MESSQVVRRTKDFMNETITDFELQYRHLSSKVIIV